MFRLLRSRPLHVDILTAFTVVLIVTVGLIVGHVYRENRRAVLTLSTQLIEQTSQQASDVAVSYLAPAQTTARVAASLARPASAPLIHNAPLINYAFEIVRLYPHLAMANIGDEQGNFLMHKRMPDGTIATKTIDRTATPPTVTWTYRDKAGQVTREETSRDVKYDPRERPWYQGARDSGDTFWTDIYIFFTDRKPGINAAHPILDPSGHCVGVIGIDIELGNMSDFLASLHIGRSGTACIVNGKGQLVAHPDATQTVRTDGKSLRPSLVRELRSAPVREAHRIFRAKEQGEFGFDLNGKNFIASFRQFPEPIRRDWRLAVVVPEDDFVGVVRRASRTALILSSVVLVLAVAVAWLLARSISKPIVALAEETAAIREFHLEDTPKRSSHIREIQRMHDAIAAMRTGLRAFRKFVPAELVRQLIRTGQGARLGGVRQRLTVCFTDIESFTTISESLDPETFMLQLSEYLDALTSVIKENEGTVDKFTGDGLMAFWGAPLPDEEHAAHACQAALLCQQAIGRLNEKWAVEGKPVLLTRIGLHTGETIVGNVGSTERMSYTALGDTVNLASRLEGTNKVYGTATIVSEATLKDAGESFVTRPLDVVAVKGRNEGIAIHELLAHNEMSGAENMARFCRSFAEAYAVWRERRWPEALSMFEALLMERPDDRPSALYVERCRDFVQAPPPDDWDGITYVQVK